MFKLTQNILDDFSFKLKKETYKGILQELKLEYCTNESGEPYIYLVLIKIKKNQRKNGYGKKVMSETIKLADEYNVPIILWATNVFGSNLERLYKFYLRLGFNFIKQGKEDDNKMIYLPKKKLILL